MCLSTVYKNTKEESTVIMRNVMRIECKDGVVILTDLMDRTVEENLLFVLRATGWKSEEEMKERIKYVLEAVGMERHTIVWSKPLGIVCGFEIQTAMRFIKIERTAIAFGRVVPAQPNKLMFVAVQFGMGEGKVGMGTEESGL